MVELHRERMPDLTRLSRRPAAALTGGRSVDSRAWSRSGYAAACAWRFR